MDLPFDPAFPELGTYSVDMLPDMQGAHRVTASRSKQELTNRPSGGTASPRTAHLQTRELALIQSKVGFCKRPRTFGHNLCGKSKFTGQR